MEQLPFPKPNSKVHEYEVWYAGRMIGRAHAKSQKQAVSFVTYRLGLIGYLSISEYKSIVAVRVYEQ